MKEMTSPLCKTAASIALVFGAFIATPASAVEIFSIDIGGISVAPPSVTSVSTSVGSGTVTEIAFDFDVQHFGMSFGSETGILITAPDLSTFSYNGLDDFGFDQRGVWSFMGSFPIAATDALGTWTFAFSDSYEDDERPDHTYLSGSSISLNGPNAVPLPATWTLLAGGIGAFGLSRRLKSI